jgi:hypothetical protein
MTEPESHTLAYLRRIDEKLDRVEGRLDRVEDELLVLNGIALRLEGREVETTGLKAILDRHERAQGERDAASPSWKVPGKGRAWSGIAGGTPRRRATARWSTAAGSSSTWPSGR